MLHEKNNNNVGFSYSLCFKLALADPISGIYDFALDKEIDGEVSGIDADSIPRKYYCEAIGNNFACVLKELDGQPYSDPQGTVIEGENFAHVYSYRTTETIRFIKHHDSYYRTLSGSRVKYSSEPFVGTWYDNSGQEGDFTFQPAK